MYVYICKYTHRERLFLAKDTKWPFFLVSHGTFSKHIIFKAQIMSDKYKRIKMIYCIRSKKK